MAHDDPFTLDLFGNTALSSGLGLGLGVTAFAGDTSYDRDDDDPDPSAPAPALPVAAVGRRASAASCARGANFHLARDRALAKGWKNRARDNIAAIRLAAAIEADERAATAEEQERLIRFTGFGASELANSVFRKPGEADFRTGWESIGEDLEDAVGDLDRASLARCTQYAHFTPEFVVRAIWAGLQRLGWRGGRVLEPGIGTGLFPALMPEGLRERSHVTGVELDPVTARIARLLQPRARIVTGDFARTELPASFDLAAGNPPFGAPWIPAADVVAFVKETMDAEIKIHHMPELASWTVEARQLGWTASGTSEWGTDRRHAGELLADALNSRVPQIFDTIKDGDSERRVLNVVDTEAAKTKLQKIKDAFQRWIWSDPDRTDRLARVYNDRFNNIAPRAFDGSHLRLPGASGAFVLYEHQKRGIWRIVSAGSTYLAHAVGAGKTMTMAAAVMEQRRLGLIAKAMLVVPGHCLAQAAREFLALYPNARILVADETNFTKDKRHRFLSRAATATWDAIIITHSAFRFISVPSAFEQQMIQDELELYETLLTKVESDDRVSRKRLERLKEGLKERLEALSTRKDDLLTISEIGVDQIIVDEAQEFPKLSFATNMSTLKGVDPNGSQRAWDLYVKSRFVETKNPGRALVLASGTPITNTLGEMFSVQRYLGYAALSERGLHEFDAWASTFGDVTTELELQPSGKYKPMTRFATFVNVPELIAMFRSFADVVMPEDLRQYVKVPAVSTGKRQILTAKPSAAFKRYQTLLAERIKAIEERDRAPEPGDDILLSVITDGRHAAIDLRLVDPDNDNEADNKLNQLVGNAFRIWGETADKAYVRSDGKPFELPGAAQMIFSDLGTISVEKSRGFSAYRWIRDELVRMGVPASEIAFMQDYKKSEAKQRLFGDVRAGKVRFLIGSSETMGTGVNAQLRLKALHHLDVPWLPSQIEQREGRIVRQGNQHDEVDIFAYATEGSLDAQMWQNNERKARFIAAALSGDTSIRRLEDMGESQANQFAMAKAIASGDPRLMLKAGLEADIARLERLRAAHIDDQHAVRRQIRDAERDIELSTRRVREIGQDIERRTPTMGDAFEMAVTGETYGERKLAGRALLKEILTLVQLQQEGDVVVASIGGFDVEYSGERFGRDGYRYTTMLLRTGAEYEIELPVTVTPLGAIARLEHALEDFESERERYRQRLPLPPRFVLRSEPSAVRFKGKSRRDRRPPSRDGGPRPSQA